MCELLLKKNTEDIEVCNKLRIDFQLTHVQIPFLGNVGAHQELN